MLQAKFGSITIPPDAVCVASTGNHLLDRLKERATVGSCCDADVVRTLL